MAGGTVLFHTGSSAETRCVPGQQQRPPVTMFDSREDGLNHRDEVLDTLVETEGIDTWHVHPVLDGAVVRIIEDHTDAVTAAFEEEGFSVKEMGVSGDWFELKVKP